MNRCNQKEDKKKNGLDVAFGLLASLLASVMFGSMFIPLKKFNTGIPSNLITFIVTSKL